jgi:phosphopantothenoylcysteine synthetase/decarboxylase
MWKSGGQIAHERSMGFINSLSSNYLPSILANAVQSSGLTPNTTANSSSASGPSSIAPADNQQLSPFAQMLGSLQQLQQSDPSKYQQVTQQIATNLQSAAQTAQADGNSIAATQLNQLSTDFSNASTTGQLPNIQDLAQATAGHHHHGGGHHHMHAASSDPDSSSTDPSTTGTLNQTLSQRLSNLQANGTANGSLDPMAIILNTLSGAGVTGSNS